jgi:hypothetical protein
MSDEIITTKRGVYGRIQVTLPLPVKTSMLAWVKKSGMGKAEFLRAALMIGAVKLADDIQAKEPNESYYSREDQEAQAAART